MFELRKSFNKMNFTATLRHSIYCKYIESSANNFISAIFFTTVQDFYKIYDCIEHYELT